jgi:hypothetical protein
MPMIGVAQDRGQNEVFGELSYSEIGEASTTNIDVSCGRCASGSSPIRVSFSSRGRVALLPGPFC